MKLQILNELSQHVETVNKKLHSASIFQPLDGLPDHSGPPSTPVSPVRSVTHGSKPRGKCAKFRPEQLAAISLYDSMRGNQVAVCYCQMSFLTQQTSLTPVHMYESRRCQMHTKKILLKALLPKFLLYITI